MHLVQIIAAISIGTGFLSALVITVDILAGNKQHMMVMNFVYPITALYAGLLGLLVYYAIGRKSSRKMMHSQHSNMHMHHKPFWQSVVVGALHCGSGCTLGDIIAECLLSVYPLVLFGSTL